MAGRFGPQEHGKSGYKLDRRYRDIRIKGLTDRSRRALPPGRPQYDPRHDLTGALGQHQQQWIGLIPQADASRPLAQQIRKNATSRTRKWLDTSSSGRDSRQNSPSLHAAVCQFLTISGVYAGRLRKLS
jgi:hypothetical protein